MEGVPKWSASAFRSNSNSPSRPERHSSKKYSSWGGRLGTIPDENATVSRLEDLSSEEASPVPWSEYFEEQRDVQLASRRGLFHMYTAGQEGPVLLFLHGAGFTGLSWAPVVKEILARGCQYRAVAPDHRGHGLTKTEDDSDLSADTLAADAITLWQELFGAEAPPTVIIGHAMGAAAGIHAAATFPAPKALVGLMAVDVVTFGEDATSLPHIMSIVAGQQAEFDNFPAALNYALRSGRGRNPATLRVSLAAMLVPVQLSPEGAAGHEGVDACADASATRDVDGAGPRHAGAPQGAGPKLTWRANVAASRPHWETWYHGLSALFLACQAPKALVLSKRGPLDKDLERAAMQGKFQLEHLPQAGYAVHEDEPEAMAQLLLDFLTRYRIGNASTETTSCPAHRSSSA